MRQTNTVIRITYEWDLEQFDIDSDDIIDHDFHDDCPGLPDERDVDVRLVLVRNTWKGLHDRNPRTFNDTADLTDRQWAYVDGGKLPDEFDGGAKVPQRFHRELARSMTHKDDA